MTKKRTTTTTMMTDRLGEGVVVVTTNLVDQPATTARWMPLTTRIMRAPDISEWLFEEKRRRDRKSQGRKR